MIRKLVVGGVFLLGLSALAVPGASAGFLNTASQVKQAQTNLTEKAGYVRSHTRRTKSGYRTRVRAHYRRR